MDGSLIHQLHNLLGIGEKDLSLARNLNRFARPVKQHHLELLLKLLYMMTDCWLRTVQPSGRLSEGTTFRKHNKSCYSLHRFQSQPPQLSRSLYSY
ncbi:hypothetical protein D3C80_1875120 [compost metagenome]